MAPLRMSLPGAKGQNWCFGRTSASGVPRSRFFDLVAATVFGGKNKNFSKDLLDSNLYSLCLYSSHSGVQSNRSCSSRLEIYGRDVRDAVNFLIAILLKHFSRLFASLSSSSFSFRTFQLSRHPLFSFIRGGRPRGMLHVPRFIFSFASSPSAYFGESFCISNSNSCKDSTCPTALRSFFDAARTVPMTFLVKFLPCCSLPE